MKLPVCSYLYLKQAKNVIFFFFLVQNRRMGRWNRSRGVAGGSKRGESKCGAKKCVLKQINAKMIPFETIPEMGRGRDKGE
jgi:hypothetical protein